MVVIKKTLVVIFVGLVLIFSYIFYKKYSYEFHFENGIKLKEVVSLSGDYTAQAYYINYGGAAGGVIVYVNIISKTENNAETVYASNGLTDFDIEWTKNNKLYVKNTSSGGKDQSIKLTVGKDIYDKTGRACFKYNITKKYFCYSEKSKEIPMLD